MPIYGHTGLIRHPRSTITYNGAMDSSGIKERVYNAWYLGNPCCCREYNITMYAYCTRKWTICPASAFSEKLGLCSLDWYVDFAFECSGKWYNAESGRWENGYRLIRSAQIAFAQAGGTTSYENVGMVGYLENFVKYCPLSTSRWKYSCDYRYVSANIDTRIPPGKADKVMDCQKNIDITERVNHYCSNNIYPIWFRPAVMDCTRDWDGWFWIHPPEIHTVQRPSTIFDLDGLNVQEFLISCDEFHHTDCWSISYGQYPSPDNYWMVRYDGDEPRWVYDAYQNPVGYKPFDLWDAFQIDSSKRCQQAQIA